MALPPERVLLLPKLFHVAPLSVDTWKLTVPVGTGKLPMPVTVTVSVTDSPKVMLDLERIVRIVGCALLVVNSSAVASLFAGL